MLTELGVTPSKVVEAPDGCVRLWTARPGLVFSQASGRMVSEHAESIIAAVEDAIRERPREVAIIHDLFEVESYEISVHTRMSTWSVSTFRKVRRVAIGVRSPLISLAVRTVNLAVGGRFELLESSGELLALARRELAFGTARAQAR
ncbi:MAG: hypothetical protein QM778_14830 [Myxococcales bacterium]